MQKQPSRGVLLKNHPEEKAGNPQENIHAKVQTQQSRSAAFMKPHSNADSPPQIQRKNPPKYLLTIAPPKDCISIYSKIQINLK